MQRFSMAHSHTGTDPAGSWHGLLDDCLAQLDTLPAAANLGFVYATSPLAPYTGALVEALRRATRVPHWVGGVGLGISCTGREYYDTPALALLVGEFPQDSFRIVPGLHSGLEALRVRSGTWYRRHRHHFGLFHGDPHNPLTPKLLRQLGLEVPGAGINGGLIATTDLSPAQIADSLGDGALSGVLFGPQVRITQGLTQGCVPLGAAHTVTACEANVLHGLDHRPALDVLYEDCGEMLARDPRRMAGYIFAGFPLGQEPGGDYLVRALLGLDIANRRIMLGEGLRPGQTLMFCRRDGNSARDDLLRMLRDLRRRLPGPARGGVYVSCLGRGRHLFGEDSQELKLIRDELGNVPLVGFFANGEFFHNRLYGYTGVLNLFS